MAEESTVTAQGNTAAVEDQQTATPEAVTPETQEQQTETTPADTTETQPEGAPETYEFAPPEGFESLNQEALNAAIPVFKDLGLTQEQAQKLVNVQAQFVQQQQQASQEAYNAQIDQWAEQVRADKEIGGKGFDQAVAISAKAIDQFGSPELRAFLNESGIGNHPELVKFAYRVGKALSEDSFVPGGNTNGGEKSRSQILYGS